MTIRIISAFAAACIVGGCAAVPAPPPADGIKVSEVVDAVQCELARVYLTTPPEYVAAVRNWVAGVVLTLKVTDEVESRPTVTITPAVSPGTLTLVVGPDFDDQSQRIAEIQFNVHMRDLDPEIFSDIREIDYHSASELAACRKLKMGSDSTVG